MTIIKPLSVSDYHAAVFGDACHDEDEDHVCDGCGVSMVTCRDCGGCGYHRPECPVMQEEGE